jgi:fido (protein-threonine AMPylation protein)
MSYFEEYIRQGEAEQVAKSYAWQTAIGLQEVDGLKPSPYLIENAKQNIEGKLTIDEVRFRIKKYYQPKVSRKIVDRTEEADKVSTRIVEILSEQTFTFSPAAYIAIHKRLFIGVYQMSGKVRAHHLQKLENAFEPEKQFNYRGTNLWQMAQHIADFALSVWCLHAFAQGNTRTIAVFIIKYLRTFGLEITNTPFAEHSWYFRNALVHANYNDFKYDIYATKEYLYRFFWNLLLGKNNDFKNSKLLAGIDDIERVKEENVLNSKSTISPFICTLKEQMVLEFLKNNPCAKEKELAAHLNKSITIIAHLSTNLQKKGLIIRRNGKSLGYWEVINE